MRSEKSDLCGPIWMVGLCTGERKIRSLNEETVDDNGDRKTIKRTINRLRVFNGLLTFVVLLVTVYWLGSWAIGTMFDMAHTVKTFWDGDSLRVTNITGRI